MRPLATLNRTNFMRFYSETTVNQPVQGLSGKTLKVSISDTAAQKLLSISKEDKQPNLALRIHVESGGCHGFQYVFQLQDTSSITPKDSVFEKDGAKVIIDHNSLNILRDSTIDYATELIGSQFKIQSPHTSSSCGCGSSFSIDPED